MEEMHSQSDAHKWKAVYTIIDKEGGGKAVWLRIGTAWVNRDQSLNVKLDASPTNGKLHIRDADPERFANGKRSEGNGARSDGNGARSDGNGARDSAYDAFGSFPSTRRGDGGVA